MKFSVAPALFFLVALPLAAGHGQSGTYVADAPTAAEVWMGEPGDQEGPDHAVYKDGYNLVLDEKWVEARKKFDELLSKYPKTSYANDARYWSAYALMHTDLKKALASYKELLQKYPKSAYYDDAVADMANIQAQLESSGRVAPRAHVDYMPVVPTAPPEPAAPAMTIFNAKMRHFSRNMRMFGKRMSRSFGSSAWSGENNNQVDEKTRLKLDALAAIGENTEDEGGFATLKKIALDRKQPYVLRAQAVNLLSDFEKQDVDAVYMEIVRTDTSEDLRAAAIDHIGESSNDKNKTVETLTTLFNSLPQKRDEERATALYRIADVGNDRAVDFLIKVAKTDADYDVRSDAIYYLGNIGGEKARTALYDILNAQ